MFKICVICLFDLSLNELLRDASMWNIPSARVAIKIVVAADTPQYLFLCEVLRRRHLYRADPIRLYLKYLLFLYPS